MRWYLGQAIPKGYRLPEGTSHSINISLALKIPHEGNRLMVLRRAVELARDGVRLDVRYQK